MAEIPHASDAVSGCMIHRGESVLLVDIRSRLGFVETATQPVRRTAILLRSSSEKLIGLEVDELGDVVKLDPQRLVDRNNATAASLATSIIPGDRMGGGDSDRTTMMLLLDLNAIMSAAGVEEALANVA